VQTSLVELQQIWEGDGKMERCFVEWCRNGQHLKVW